MTLVWALVLLQMVLNKRRRKAKRPQFTFNTKEADAAVDVEVDYVTRDMLDKNDPLYDEFSRVFMHFQPEQEKEQEETSVPMEIEEEFIPEKISNRKMKQQTRMPIAELKQNVMHPEAVEAEDITAPDPLFLVYLKSIRNGVPVPGHWSTRRKYLTGKRGFVKPPFDLPNFIKDTGIMELRASSSDKDIALKARLRNKTQPRLGRQSVNYERLHDAFFKHQTKPRLTIQGDIYFEGKEYESRLKEKKPGVLSEELKMALGISNVAPPPWLANMQRFGPPPSYPRMRIPGLNCPIPEGAQWGYHTGGWGKPPVDQDNRPLYGDVFGSEPEQVVQDQMPVDRTIWGEIEVEEETEALDQMEDAEQPAPPEEEEQGPELIHEIEIKQPAVIETPAEIEPRKSKKLFQVLETKETPITGFLGSQYTYKINSDVQVSLDPSELENLNEKNLEAKFDSQTAPLRTVTAPTEDLSDMVQQHAIKAEKKRVADKTKKSKEFKF